jgi:hypothetical protein
MYLLGYFEERHISLYDAPACVNAKLYEQRQHSLQNLRYASTRKCGVYVLDDLARQFVCQQPQVVNYALAYYRLIVCQLYLRRFSIRYISRDFVPSSVKVYGSNLAISSASSGSSRLCSSQTEKSFVALCSRSLDSKI